MEIYIVIRGTYDYQEVVGVFSSYNEADAYTRDNEDDLSSMYSFHIEGPHILDEPDDSWK